MTGLLKAKDTYDRKRGTKIQPKEPTIDIGCKSICITEKEKGSKITHPHKNPTIHDITKINGHNEDSLERSFVFA
jgi:hypothetical protein